MVVILVGNHDLGFVFVQRETVIVVTVDLSTLSTSCFTSSPIQRVLSVGRRPIS
jgi:hypothetical protein